jgi:hypothetical protein
MEKVYQFQINDYSIHESDWQDCTESQYNDMDGHGIVTRIIERQEQANEWDDLWYKFTKTPEYRQSIKALQFRAFYDWLKNNFNTPTKK